MTTQDLLQRLNSAHTDEEREWLVLEFSLGQLDPRVGDAVWAVAVPHWFDAAFLAALLDIPDEDALQRFAVLKTLSFVEPFPGRGYNIHERSRTLLRNRLRRENPEHARLLSQRAATFCATQDQSDTLWRTETIYHLVMSESPEALGTFVQQGIDWTANAEWEKVEALTQAIIDDGDLDFINHDVIHWGNLLLGEAHFMNDRYDAAHSSSEKVLLSKNPLLTGYAFDQLGRIAFSKGEVKATENYFQKGILICREHNLIQPLAKCLNGLANLASFLGNHETSLKLLEEAQAYYHQMKDKTGEAACIYGRGEINGAEGRFRKARKYFKAAELLYAEGKSKAGLSNTAMSLGKVNYHLREYKAAVKRLSTAVSLARELHDQVIEAHGNLYLALTYFKLGDETRALTHGEESLRISTAIGNPIEEANSRRWLAVYHINKEGYETAKQHLEKAAQIYEALGATREASECVKMLKRIEKSSETEGADPD